MVDAKAPGVLTTTSHANIVTSVNVAHVVALKLFEIVGDTYEICRY